jgi:hypothetical protein
MGGSWVDGVMASFNRRRSNAPAADVPGVTKWWCDSKWLEQAQGQRYSIREGRIYVSQ